MNFLKTTVLLFVGVLLFGQSVSAQGVGPTGLIPVTKLDTLKRELYQAKCKVQGLMCEIQDEERIQYQAYQKELAELELVKRALRKEQDALLCKLAYSKARSRKSEKVTIRCVRPQLTAPRCDPVLENIQRGRDKFHEGMCRFKEDLNSIFSKH